MADERNWLATGLALFFVNPNNLGDDFASLFHIEHVTLVDVQLFDDVCIVQRCAFDDGAAQQHWVKVSHRCDDTRAAHLEGHELQPGAFAFRGELIGNRPSRGFGRGAQVELLAQGIDFEHEAIGGNWQFFSLYVPVADEVLHGVDAGQDGHFTRLESPSLEGHNSLIMALEWQIVAQQEVEDGIQTTARNLGTVLQLEGSGGSIAGIGKQWLFVELAFLIEFLKTLPRQQDFATDLKFVRQIVHTSNFEGYRLDGDDIGGHVITLHTVATSHGTHQTAMLIGDRNRRAVIFHLSHDLAFFSTQALLGTTQEILHLFNAVTVGK